MTTPDQIIKTVAEYYHISVGELKERKRITEIKEARFIAIYFIRRNTFMPLAKIGRMISSSEPFGHDTMINAITKVNNWIEYDSTFRDKVRAIGNIIEGVEDPEEFFAFMENDCFPAEVEFENKFKDLAPVNGNGYSGYRSHSL